MSEPEAPFLSAALIVRDEERFLEGCLRSIAAVVDETVVVDTGSGDRTPEIARDLGARLLLFPWGGDFSAARNHALDAARGRFILYIDADERVVAGDRSTLIAALAPPDVAAGTVLFRVKTGFTRFREYRLFRRHPRLRFSGVIHETFVPALFDWTRETGMRIVDTALAIDHLGYDGDVSHKHPRNLPLLEERLRRDPGHLYSWCHLAMTLEGLGREEEARAAWRRAVETIRRRGGSGGVDVIAWVGLLHALRRADLPFDADLAEAKTRFASNPTLLWFTARAALDRGATGEAAAVFERLLAIEPDRVLDASVAHREEIFGLWSLDSLALCRFREGRFDEAAALWRQAEERAGEPADLGRRARRSLAEAKARRVPGP